jgi:hypothetical protein
MFSKSYWWKITLAASLATVGWSATFGTVVSIGGHASDLALDEPRGVLYIANFTANRVEVMSLSSNAIRTSINVAAQPSSRSHRTGVSWWWLISARLHLRLRPTTRSR